MLAMMVPILYQRWDTPRAASTPPIVINLRAFVLDLLGLGVGLLQHGRGIW